MPKITYFKNSFTIYDIEKNKEEKMRIIAYASQDFISLRIGFDEYYLLKKYETNTSIIKNILEFLSDPNKSQLCSLDTILSESYPSFVRTYIGPLERTKILTKIKIIKTKNNEFIELHFDNIHESTSDIYTTKYLADKNIFYKSLEFIDGLM